MTTPAVLYAAKNFDVPSKGAFAFTWDVKTQAGVNLDISSGYSAQIFVQPFSTPNPEIYGNLGVALHSYGTFTYSVVGKLTWTVADGALAAFLHSLRNRIVVYVTNDSGTTLGEISSGSLNIFN